MASSRTSAKTRVGWALFTLGILLAALSPVGAASAGAATPAIATTPGPDPVCERTLAEVRAHLVAHRTEFDFATAAAYLLERSAKPCGWMVGANGYVALELEPPADVVPAVDRGCIVPGLVTPCTVDDRDGSEEPAYPLPVGHAEWLIDTTLRIVPCQMPGSGTGTIRGEVLGIAFGNWTAAGTWKVVMADLQVAGDSGTFGGTQGGGIGVITVAGAALPAMGETNGWCVETTTTTLVQQTCWWLVIYSSCTQKVETKVTLTPCAAEARQELFPLAGVLSLQHFYATNTPC